MDGIGKVGTGTNVPQKVETAPVKKEEAVKIDTKDGLTGSVEEKPKEMAGWKRGIIKMSDRITGTLGVLAGGALGTAGLYVGAIGGAVALGITGLAIGPAIAAVTTSGVLSGIGSTFATAGLVGKAGLVTGSALTGYGMFKAGRGIVESVGTGVRKVLGAPSQKEEAGEVGAPKKPGFIETLVAGVGSIAGVAGGAIAGASIAAAGATVAGLMATGVTLAAISGPAATGALIGAAAFGIGGFTGSWSAIDKVKSGAKKLINKFKKTKVKLTSSENGEPSKLDKMGNGIKKMGKKMSIPNKMLAVAAPALAVGIATGCLPLIIPSALFTAAGTIGTIAGAPA